MLFLRPTARLSVLKALLFALMVLSMFSQARAHDPLHSKRGHAHDTDHPVSHVLLAAADIGKARALVLAFRETGDDRNLDKAWAELSPALDRPGVDAETLVTAAFVAQSRHEFARADGLLERALHINPRNNEARLLRASIHLVRGEAAAAGRACGQLQDVTPLVFLTCKARVAAATGDHAPALTRLSGVLNAIDLQRLPSDLAAWSFSVAGDLAAAAGESRQAVTYYRRSLKLAERTQVRAALVDVHLSESDYDDAWQALESGSQALPLLVRQLITAKRLGRLHELQTELTTVQLEFEEWIAQEDWLHAREMARFFIDVIEKPALARRLSLINIGLQREPEDLRLEYRTRGYAESLG